MYPRLALNLQSSCLRLWNYKFTPCCLDRCHSWCWVECCSSSWMPTRAISTPVLCYLLTSWLASHCCSLSSLQAPPLLAAINPSISGCSIGFITKPKTNKPTNPCSNLPKIHFWNCRRTTMSELSNVGWPHEINGTVPCPESI